MSKKSFLMPLSLAEDADYGLPLIKLPPIETSKFVEKIKERVEEALTNLVGKPEIKNIRREGDSVLVDVVLPVSYIQVDFTLGKTEEFSVEERTGNMIRIKAPWRF